MTALDLTAANTLAVPSQGERVLAVRDEDSLRRLVEDRLQRPAPKPLTVLGGGSNVVLRRYVSGDVCLVRTRGVRMSDQGGGIVHVSAAAGERWHDLVRYSLGRGLAGLENLALIPGSVGAAPLQNIGAYGVELADVFVRLRALDTRNGDIVEFDRAACRFAYRDSVFKSAAGHAIVLDVTLALRRRPVLVLDYPDLHQELRRLGYTRPTPVQVAEAVVRVRRRKLPDPRHVGNVGSFFKNPVVTVRQAESVRRQLPTLGQRLVEPGRVKLSAAQLIEACGWKGRTPGRVGVWQRQPLVLVNRGGATGRDVLALGEDIRRDVAERFDIDLEREPQVIGQD